MQMDTLHNNKNDVPLEIQDSCNDNIFELVIVCGILKLNKILVNNILEKSIYKSVYTCFYTKFVVLQLNYINWAPRSPSLYLQEACVGMYSSGYNRQGKWNDMDCMARRGYVCQVPAGKNSQSYYNVNNNP